MARMTRCSRYDECLTKAFIKNAETVCPDNCPGYDELFREGEEFNNPFRCQWEHEGIYDLWIKVFEIPGKEAISPVRKRNVSDRVPKYSSRARIPKHITDQINEMRRAGRGPMEIAKILGISDASVSAHTDPEIIQKAKDEKERIESIVLEMAREGIRTEIIVQETGVSQKTICRIRNDNGIPKPIPLRKQGIGYEKGKKVEAKVKKLFSEGYNYSEIARKIGYNPQSIPRILRRAKEREKKK